MKKMLGLKITPIVLLVAVIVWFADAAIDALVFSHGGFIETALTDVSGHELFFRLFFITVYSAITLFIARALIRSRTVTSELQRYIAAVESSMDGIAIIDGAGNFQHVNQAYAKMYGYDAPRDAIGKPFRSFYDERSVSLIDQIVDPSVGKSGRWRGELIAKRKNGSTFYQEVSVTQIDGDSRVTIVRDITWRKRSVERLRRSEHFLNMIFNSVRDPFCIFDSEYQIIRINDAYAQMKGKTEEDLIGRKCFEALNDRDSICEGCVVDKTFQSTDPCAKEKHIQLPGGADAWVEIYTYPILDEEGKVSHVIEYTRDITQRKRAEEDRQRLIGTLEHLSRTDALTGLLNRRALAESLRYEIERAGRYRSDLSVLLCDLDRFKDINDTYGHDAGDRVLQTIAAILKTIFRKTDIVGRYGGDEFMLILPETSLAGAENLVEKLGIAMRDADLRLPKGAKERLTMSIGIAFLADPLESMDSFVKRADEDMYVRKNASKDGPSAGLPAPEGLSHPPNDRVP